MRIKHIEIRNFRGIKYLSWQVKGDFNCIIGPGDTCKTTILTALDYALSPRSVLSFDDSDFFNHDVIQAIIIQVTLANWAESLDNVRRFFPRKQICPVQSCGYKYWSFAGTRAWKPSCYFLSLYVLIKILSLDGPLYVVEMKKRTR